MLALKTMIHVSRSDRERNPAIQNVQDKLNELGEGWDLVSVQYVRLETEACLLLHTLNGKNLKACT